MGYSPRGHKESDTTEVTEHTAQLLVLNEILRTLMLREVSFPLSFHSVFHLH